MAGAAWIGGLCLSAGACASTQVPVAPGELGPPQGAVALADEDVARSGAGVAWPTDSPAYVPGVSIHPAASALDDDSDLDATAEDVAKADVPEEESGWTITPMAMAWIPSVNGSVTVAGAKVRPSLTVGDFWSAWKDTQTRTIEFHANAQHESGWGVFGEIIDLKLEADDTATAVVGPVDPIPGLPFVLPGRKIGVEVDATLRWTMLELGVAYDVTSEALAEKGVQLHVIGGGRYWEVDVDLELNGRNLTKDDADWLDAFVGIHTITRLSEDDAWSLLFRGDVGGGGIGESSKIATRFVGLLRYRPTDRWHLSLGWNHLGNDWSQGSGSSEKAWNLRLSGPVLTIGYDF